jgi:hypothetical protein
MEGAIWDRQPANINTLRLPSDPGVYVFLLCNELKILNGKTFPAGQVLYVGKSKSLCGRMLRQHLSEGGTGSSTFRRSLGALLKSSEMLKAIPRGCEKNRINITHYRFESEGEARLSAWIAENLEVSTLVVRDYVERGKRESGLIKDCEPLLNLQGWENPLRGYIESLRRECRGEAERWENG